MDLLGERLAHEFDRGFEANNLHRVVQFAQSFADEAIVATLSRQLSWSHVVPCYSSNRHRVTAPSPSGYPCFQRI